MGRLPLLLALWGCSGGADTPATPQGPPVAPEAPVAPPAAAAAIPAVQFHVPTCDHKTQAPTPSTPALDATRAKLRSVVQTYGMDPTNAWAIGHGLLALGKDATLPDGSSAVDHLFTTWAEELVVGSETLVRFPTKKGDVRVEPHSDLVLKALTEVGVAPDRAVTVAGRPHTVGDLYRGSLERAWVDGDQTGFGPWNDTPWALQGISAWAPAGLAWTADGGHTMTIDRFTHEVVGKLAVDNAFLREALAKRTVVEKRGQGIWDYTCGGAHLIQGATFAVGRGFGEPTDADRVRADLTTMFYRLSVETKQVDVAIEANPTYRPILVVQRLKFLGHLVETMHKASALGVYSPNELERSLLDKAAGEVVATVDALDKMGVYDKLAEVRPKNEQFYLDVIGDSAHALRGLDLATGNGTLCY